MPLDDILIITVDILVVLIYSDSYIIHDQDYLRFFNTSVKLVNSSNLIQIYLFLESILEDVEGE